MSLHRNKNAFIGHGWTRALLLLIVHSAVSALIGSLTWSLPMWFMLSSFSAILLVYVFRVWIDRRSFVSIGLEIAGFHPDAIIGLLFGPFLLFIGSLMIYGLNGLQWTRFTFNPDDLLFSLILLMILSVGEEVVYRGYVLRNLMKSFDKWVALVISALLFAIFHTANNDLHMLGFINVAMGGMLVGISYMYTKNLWFPIFFHFSWNFFQGPVLGFPVSGFPFHSMLTLEPRGISLINGGSFGFEGSIICTVLLAGSFIFTCYLYNKKGPEER